MPKLGPAEPMVTFDLTRHPIWDKRENDGDDLETTPKRTWMNEWKGTKIIVKTFHDTLVVKL